MKIKLLDTRLSFPDLFEAKAFAGSDKATYGGSFLIAKTDKQVKAIDDAIELVAQEKWGAKAADVLKALRAGDKLCKHDGNNKSYDGYADHFYVSATNVIKPTVVDVNKAPLTTKDGKPYSGSFVHVVLEIWAQDNQYGKRVNATLMGVQFSRDGDRFTGGGVASEDDFDDITSGADADSLV